MANGGPDAHAEDDLGGLIRGEEPGGLCDDLLAQFLGADLAGCDRGFRVALTDQVVSEGGLSERDRVLALTEVELAEPGGLGSLRIERGVAIRPRRRAVP